MLELPAPMMGLKGGGGCGMTNLCGLLKLVWRGRVRRRDATVVTYDESAAKAFDLTASYFTVNNLCLKGFNMKK